jgi:hypothetical protein
MCGAGAMRIYLAAFTGFVLDSWKHPATGRGSCILGAARRKGPEDLSHPTSASRETTTWCWQIRKTGLSTWYVCFSLGCERRVA